MRFVLRNDNNITFVTSACAGEGKSTTATNLACAYANAGVRVLLIDADLRNPSLHRTLDIVATTGLADYLQGNIDTNELVQATAFSNLSLIPAGKLPEDPSELLSSPGMKTLLEANKDFVEISNKKKEHKSEKNKSPESGQTNVTNNNLILSTADLLKMLSDK
jgi:capsular exopolysaccharide synthesis family protein